METGTTIIGLVVILAIAIPFALLSFKKKKKGKEFLLKLNDFAKKNNCEISEFDHWDTSLIGIDNKAEKLFFMNYRADGIIEKIIPLDEIQRCRTINSSRTIKNQKQSSTVIDKIELAFTYRDKNKTDEVIEFYNSVFDGFVLSNELIITEKWQKIMDAFLLDKAKK
jgi:hypothetical protein